MFSLILSVLVLNNKLNGVPITNEFYNFAIFCIAVDTLLMLAVLYSMYKGTRNSTMYALVVIYAMGITQSALVLNSSKGSQLTNESYMVAISYIAIAVLLNVYLNGGKIRGMMRDSRVSPY